MLLLTFVWKKLLYLFVNVFINNAWKSCAPFIEILSPMERSSHVTPLNFSPPPKKKQKKSTWKRLYTSQQPLVYVNNGQSL